MAPSPADTLSTVARASSNPPASPEDDTQELSCTQGWFFPPRVGMCFAVKPLSPRGPQSRRWPQVLGATVPAWPEQQQLVALALPNLRECDADEYERGDVAATAGAAAGAAPALQPVLSWAEPTARPLQQQFVSVPMELGLGTGMGPANS